MTSPDHCPVCGGPVHEWVVGLPAAVAGEHVDTYECERCGAAFVWPLQIPEGLYERLYADERTPGYRRYRRFADAVAGGRWGLSDLARQQDVYWAVERVVSSLPEGSQVLEYGSGLGYLTGALRREGFDAEGVDVSRRAVEEARATIGPWFHLAREGAAASAPGRVDLVISLETIEHVQEPLQFLATLVERARPGGRVLLTTPNRDAVPDALKWWSDLPPVHLFWFRERSIEVMARRLGCEVELLDFTGFHERYRASVPDGSREVIPPPMLSASGHPDRLGHAKAVVLDATRQMPALDRLVRNSVDRLRPHRLPLSRRSHSIAAVLTTPS